MLNRSMLLSVVLAAAFFTACDDDSVSSSSNTQQSGCTFSENKDGTYTVSCADGTKVTLHDGKDGANGTDGKNGTNGADGKDGTNGTDGKNGANGTDGKDGTNGTDGKDGANGTNGSGCVVSDTTDLVSDRAGYKLVCGAELKGVVWNGIDGIDGGRGIDGIPGEDGDPGDPGDDGEDGTNCTVADTTDEVNNRSGYSLTCGEEYKGTVWNGTAGIGCTVEVLSNDAGSKILCGGDSVGVVLNEGYGMCGAHTYSLYTHFCDTRDNKVYSKCGSSESYDPYTQVCNLQDNKVYNKCGPSELYDPSTHFCDTRDNQIYRIVSIGIQIWMAENLNYETETDSYCYYNKADSCAKYGRLYAWSVATSICPEGWHLPSNEEWETLFDAVGGTSLAGDVLKSTTEWYDNGNGTDAFGFGGLPAGIRISEGDMGDVGSHAYFWSSTAFDSDQAYFWYFYYGNGNVDRGEYAWDGGLSVRCVRYED